MYYKQNKSGINQLKVCAEVKRAKLRFNILAL